MCGWQTAHVGEPFSPPHVVYIIFQFWLVLFCFSPSLVVFYCIYMYIFLNETLFCHSLFDFLFLTLRTLSPDARDLFLVSCFLAELRKTKNQLTRTGRCAKKKLTDCKQHHVFGSKLFDFGLVPNAHHFALSFSQGGRFR